jgi:CheY-like chemotaxis protein
VRKQAASSLIASDPIAWIAVVPPASLPTSPARRDSSALVRVDGSPAGASISRQPGDDGRSDSRRDREAQAAAGKRSGPILVVDDDRSILATVVEILELEGYPVIAVADGAEALRRAAEVEPSLLLLDMRMPGVTGWEVARRLRERGSAPPILVMTAAQDARLWAEQIGAAGYLPKPFDLDDLLTAVERLWPA